MASSTSDTPPRSPQRRFRKTRLAIVIGIAGLLVCLFYTGLFPWEFFYNAARQGRLKADRIGYCLNILTTGRTRSEVRLFLGAPDEFKRAVYPSEPFWGAVARLHLRPGHPYERWNYSRSDITYGVWFADPATPDSDPATWKAVGYFSYPAGTVF